MTDLSGKVALVTGGTNGVGKVTARELARLGAQVTIVGRNPEKTQAVAAEIGARFLIADLSVQAEVRRAAAEFRAAHQQLDILVNNAGGIFTKRQETRDGIEMTWALNHLAYFLFTQELEPLLRATPGARVVNVSSDAHRGGRMHWVDPQFKSGYRAWRAYNQSKLANILFSRELARRLSDANVTSNSLHPGFVNSGFGHNNPGFLSTLLRFATPMQVSEDQGAQTSVYLASSPEVEGLSGLYFNNSQVAVPTMQAMDDGAAARLWALSEEMVGTS